MNNHPSRGWRRRAHVAAAAAVARWKWTPDMATHVMTTEQLQAMLTECGVRCFELGRLDAQGLRVMPPKA